MEVIWVNNINNEKDNIYGDNYLFGWISCTGGQIGSWQIPHNDTGEKDIEINNDLMALPFGGVFFII